MTEPQERAFPGINQLRIFDEEVGKDIAQLIPHGGMTKREYFAALAMQGLLAHPLKVSEIPAEPAIAGMACLMADALIAELNKEPNP